MKKNSKIYVAGHTGFIGSAVVCELEKQGYENLVLKTRKQLDLTRQETTDRFFKKERPEYVFLFAARVGGIFANKTYPADFIYENVAIQSNVINAAHKYGVKKLLFPASACMYPKYCRQPIRESSLLTGFVEPTNEAFAVAKICGAKMCEAFNRQNKTHFICVVPATAYGENDHFDKNGHVVAGLIERFHNATNGRRTHTVNIWGTGKPRREFIYVDDLARACVYLMKNYNGTEIVNIGSGEEVSIKELARRIKKQAGFKGKIIYDETKPDGMPCRLLDSSRLRRLGWKPEVKLDKGLRLAYEWYKRAEKAVIK